MESNFVHHLAIIYATFFIALCDLSSDVLFMSAQPCQNFVAFCYYYSSADCSQIFLYLCFSTYNPFSVSLMHNQHIELVSLSL